MPAATRFVTRVQDMDDYAEEQAWAGYTTFANIIQVGDGADYGKISHLYDKFRIETFGAGHKDIELVTDGTGLYLYGDGSGGRLSTSGDFVFYSQPWWNSVVVIDSDIWAQPVLVFRSSETDHWSVLADVEVPAATNGLQFRADGMEETDTKVTFLKNGNVGINIIDPSQKLTVDGNILQTTGDYLATDEVRAINGDGLKLYDDGGNGIFVKDGGQVGIGIIDLDGTFHVHTATAGVVSPNLAYNDLIIENDSHAGISILTPSASNAGIVMGRPGADTQGWLLYLHSNDKMQFGAAGSAQMTLGADGLGIGIASSSAKLHVDQAVTDAAIPVLILDQADIDQPIVKIIGTAESGSADRSLVAASDFTTPGAIVAWEMVYVQDDGNRFTDAKYYRPLYAIPTA